MPARTHIHTLHSGTGTVSTVTLVSSSGKSIAPPTDQLSSFHGNQVGEKEGHTSVGDGRGSLAAITEPKLTQSQPRIIQSGLLARYMSSD